MAGCAQPIKGIHSAGIKRRVGVDVRAVGVQQRLVACVGQALTICNRKPVSRQSEHRAPARKGRRIVLPHDQLRRVAKAAQRGIGRRDQIACGVRQRPVQIKNYCRHDTPFGKLPRKPVTG